MMNVYQSQAKIKSFNNTDMLAKGVLKSVLTTVLKYFFSAGNHA